MNLWKKIVVSLCTGVMMTVGSVLPMASASGTAGSGSDAAGRAEFAQYIRTAWQLESQEKAAAIQALQSDNLAVLDLSSMDSGQKIELDGVQKLTGLRILKCPGEKTRALVMPMKLPEHLEELYFSHSRLFRYPLEMIEEPFLHSKKLRKLRLSKCYFLLEADRALFISPTVEELDLSGNDLRFLLEPGRDLLANDPALGLLVVSPEARMEMAASFDVLKGRYGQEYIDEVSKPLTLKKLILRDCQLGQEPILAGLPGSLEELDLIICDLTALPVGLPASLKKLNLRGNNFAQVGAQAWEALVAQLPQLEELDLGLCRLRGLPIGLPASLKKLGLQSNNFAQVGAQAWAALSVQVPHLEELDLGLCRLRGLPIGLPASLKKLGLWGNNFARVGAEAWAALFAQLPQLEELNLQGCRLAALPIGLPASLKKLRLEGNNFAQVGAQAWAALSVQVPQLEELGLQGCGLRARPAGLPAHLIVRH